jgi:hypothetical protein
MVRQVLLAEDLTMATNYDAQLQKQTEDLARWQREQAEKERQEREARQREAYERQVREREAAAASNRGW